MTDQPNSSNELLPCPFCGAPGEVYDTSDNPSRNWVEIGCSDVCAFSNSPKMGSHDGYEVAKKLWNTRAPSGNASELAKEVEKKIKKVEESVEKWETEEDEDFVDFVPYIIKQLKEDIGFYQSCLAALPSKERVSISRKCAEICLKEVEPRFATMLRKKQHSAYLELKTALEAADE